MLSRKCFYLPLSILLIPACLSAAWSADLRTRVKQATHSFKDISLTCKVLYANQAELKKIGKDFPKSYEFKSTKVLYKAPDKMKMEGKLGMVKVAIVMNGNQKAIRIPSLHISKKENIKEEPHKRQTDFDMGIVTDSLWQDYIVTDVDDDKGADGPVYRITFIRSNAKDKKHLCWIDAKTFKLLKLEKYEGDGTLKSRYLYSHHKLIGDVVWVPCTIEVYNQDGKLAGKTAYENIKINSGIPDSEFKL